MSMSVQRRRDRLNDAELANNLRIVQELAVFIQPIFFFRVIATQALKNPSQEGKRPSKDADSDLA